MTEAVDIQPCDIDELRTMFLFEKLSEEQLDWLCTHGHVEPHQPGMLCVEGEPATCFYVMLNGSLSMTRRVGNEDVEITRSSQPGVYVGAWQSYLGDRVAQTYIGSVKVLEPSRFYVLGAQDFADLMNEWFPMPVHLLEGLFMGNQRSQEKVAQRERLLALGSLSAGLTHELNNPAAAAVRATSSLRERVAGMRHKLAKIAGGTWDRKALETLIELQERAVEVSAKAPDLSPLEASDREDAIDDWLDEHHCTNAYDLSPTFVASGLDIEWLDRMADIVGADMLDGALRWLGYTLETEQLMDEIEDSSNRISSLVGAAKQYSQMDRAPVQVLDVHELLDSTLVMLSRKLEGIEVVKDYDRTLPAIPVYGAELNQVWTNIIDNAVQAMAGAGTLTLRTSLVDDSVQVEIGDTGPGIPADVRERIFEPFFTTKPVGEGTGLGLDISWRIVVDKHHGDIAVASEPGDTRFTITLPIREAAQ